MSQPGSETGLRRFQRQFLSACEDLQNKICALSIPRGGGKSTLLGALIARSMVPGGIRCLGLGYRTSW